MILTIDECLKYAAMVMKRQYDKKHHPIFFSKDDFVYLKLGDGYTIPTSKVTKKLTQRRNHCQVEDRVGRLAYKLKLSPELQGCHPVISEEHLEPAGDDSVSHVEPPSTYDSRFPEEDCADVDAVVDMRYRGCGRGRRKQYLVRWKALGNQHLEWLDEGNLEGAEEKVLDFLQHHLRQF